jgi:hypothetical protein
MRARRYAPDRWRRRVRYPYGAYWSKYVWAFYSAPGRMLHDCPCDQCAAARRKWGRA